MCGHCTHFAPTYAEIASRLVKERVSALKGFEFGVQGLGSFVQCFGALGDGFRV